MLETNVIVKGMETTELLLLLEFISQREHILHRNVFNLYLYLWIEI